VPARVVLKDVDLDLAFIAPVEDPAAVRKPFAYVDLDTAAAATVLGDYYVVTRAPKALQRVPLVHVATLEGIDAKPRAVFIVANIAAGCPVFDGGGRTLGIGLTYYANGRPAGPIVMPAADVADEARQAAAVKPPPEPAPAEDESAAPAPKPAAMPSPGSAGPAASPGSEPRSLTPPRRPSRPLKPDRSGPGAAGRSMGGWTRSDSVSDSSGRYCRILGHEGVPLAVNRQQ